jgi:hypothetical protein
VGQYHPRRESAGSIVVAVQCDAHLVQIVLALHPPRRLASRLNGRQKKGYKDSGDGDDHQRFSQRESARVPVHLRFLKPETRHSEMRDVPALTNEA